MSTIRRAATVTGRVQGVSFRYHTDRQASRLGVTGWIRNAEDGSVQLEVQGEPDQVEALLRWVETGPDHARVDGVEVRELDPVPDEDDFRVTR